MISTLAMLLCTSFLVDDPSPEKPPKPTSHVRRVIEGWTVFVDERLLAREHEELGTRAVGLVESGLRIIAATVPKRRVDELRRFEIQIDLSHGELVSPQYHPSKGWLESHGYASALEKRIHIPDARYFTRSRFQRDQPSGLLHELAHAYHDQILGNDHAGIRAAFARVRESKRFEKVLHVDGHTTRHYALSNPQEFFAEMTESYLGRNDFAPFNPAELERDEPEIAALMKSIWLAPSDRRFDDK
ncbi:MAG: hypothetical protein SFX72_19365 [Isosphaeraceae bacterium]|nr:hypothetical protein [Isosphaeraceae bacterium]